MDRESLGIRREGGTGDVSVDRESGDQEGGRHWRG